MSRLWVSTYNTPRKFDNGVRWVRISVRLFGWHRLGGLWWATRWPFMKPLLPSGPKGPIVTASSEKASNGERQDADLVPLGPVNRDV